MNTEFRKLIEEFILNKTTITFLKDKTVKIILCHSNTKIYLYRHIVVKNEQMKSRERENA